jgi:arylsulfatase A-like enzyme
LKKWLTLWINLYIETEAIFETGLVRNSERIVYSIAMKLFDELISLKTIAQWSKCPLSRRQWLKNALLGSLGISLAPDFLFGGCAKSRDKRPNIILISIDTLRADHLGCYGYKRNTSPNIDLFAAESIRYSHAYAPAPWTLPSHAGMLTGIHPFLLGINGENAAIPADSPLLAGLLKKHGYQTVAFVDSLPKGFVGADRGFARGFDSFNHAPHRPNLNYIYDMAVTVEVAEKWLKDRDKSSPFFLFLHTKSVHVVLGVKNGDKRHCPYDKPEPYRSRFLTDEQAKMYWIPPYASYLLNCNDLIAKGEMDQLPLQRVEALKGQYDGGISYTDDHFGRLIKVIDNMGLSDNTVVIVTADHGEAFAEHKFFLHKEVYSQLLHVPLVIRLPAKRLGKVIQTQVALEDIAPTILKLASINIPQVLTGTTLPMDPITEQSARRFFGYYQYSAKELYDAFSLQEGDWKVVHHKYFNGKWLTELYNIVDDPDELKPVEGPDKLRATMSNSLLNWIAEHQDIKSPQIQLDSETIEHLKSLGYVR